MSKTSLDSFVEKLKLNRYLSQRGGKCRGIDMIRGIKLRCDSSAFCCPTHSDGDCKPQTNGFGCLPKSDAIFENPETLPTRDERKLRKLVNRASNANYKLDIFLREQEERLGVYNQFLIKNEQNKS